MEDLMERVATEANTLGAEQPDQQDTPAEFASTQKLPPPRLVRGAIRQRRGVWRLLRANLYDLSLLVRQARVPLAFFGAVLVIGTVYEHGLTLYDHANMPYMPSWPESLYATLQLLIFQQSNQAFPSDPIGQSLFFLLPLLGLLVLVQSVLNFGRRILDKGSRLQAWQVALATTFRGHVIVCGLGRVGIRVVRRLLEAGYEVVVIEQDFNSQFVARALALRVPVIAGDARERITLDQAGLARAHAVIAGINGDLLNIQIALAARQARPHLRVVLRAFSEELDQQLVKIFDEDSTFSHSALAAPTIAAAAISRDITYAIPVGDALLAIAELVVQRGSALSGALVRACEEQCRVRVVDQQTANGSPPRGDLAKATLRPGDRITLLGTLAGLEDLRARNRRDGEPWPLQHPTPAYNKVIICGLGKVGYRVVQRLAGLESRPEIVVVTRGSDDSSFVERITGLPGVTLLSGDAREIKTLQQAGIDQAYAVAAVTSDDLTNLQIGLNARAARPDVHLVVRVFTDALADELNDVYEIHTTYSTSTLASPTLAAAAIVTEVRGGGVDRAFIAGGRLFSSDAFTAVPHGLLSGQTIASLRARRGLLVIAMQRGGRQELLPPLETPIGPNEEGILVAPLRALERLSARRR
jgi:Trk K+ transport system NAD-binding subunit